MRPPLPPLLLALLLLPGTADGTAQCFMAGFTPHRRLQNRKNTATMEYRDVHNVNDSDTATVCQSILYEVQWTKGVKTEDAFFGYTLLNGNQKMKIAKKYLVEERNITSNRQLTRNICQRVEEIDFIDFYNNPLPDSSRMNWAFSCFCFDPHGICNDFTFLKVYLSSTISTIIFFQTEYARITYENKNMGLKLIHTPLQSLNFQEYTTRMADIWGSNEPRFSQPSRCYERYIHQPFGFAKINVIDLLNESVRGTMFYSGYYYGVIWCAMTIGHISSSHGTVIPFPKYTTANVFSDGFFQRNDSLIAGLELDGDFICFEKTKSYKDLFLRWERPYMPADKTDSAVLLCACNKDYCNNLENTKLIRDRYYRGKLGSGRISGTRYEEDEIWPDAYPSKH